MLFSLTFCYICCILVVWMKVPRFSRHCSPYDCPFGLESLTAVDMVICKQTPDDVVSKYVVLNALGQKIYDVYEDSNICCRMVCANQRSLSFRFVNAKHLVSASSDFQFQHTFHIFLAGSAARSEAVSRFRRLCLLCRVLLWTKGQCGSSPW